MKKLIEVDAYCSDDGQPTCAVDMNEKKYCMFLKVLRFGLVDICIMTGDEVYRDAGGYGFIRPCEGCPVWK